jgi:hypothetical protein
LNNEARLPRRNFAYGELLLALPKSNQKASPCCPPYPPVLALYVNECGTRQRHTKALLTLRTVCADDASTTAQRSALRGGQKGRWVHGTPTVRESQNATCSVLSEIRLIAKVITFVIATLLVLLGALFAPPLLGDWLFVNRTKELAGSDAIDCGRVDPTQDPSLGVACVKRAMNEKRPFRIVIDRRGIDSKVANGLVLDASGTSHLLA